MFPFCFTCFMRTPLTWQLIVVAVVFIINGLYATFQVTALYLHGQHIISLGVLSSFIGLGLLWRQPAARVFAFLYSAINVLFGMVQITLSMMSFRWLPHLSSWLILLAIGVGQAWLLTREDVNQIFRKKMTNETSWKHKRR